MLPPYQCLLKCGKVLLAATSCNLDSFSIEDGSQLSSWTSSIPLEENADNNTPPTEETSQEDPEPKNDHRAKTEPDSESPTKKRRISYPNSTKQVTTRKSSGHKAKQQNAVIGRQEPPAVVALASTRGGLYVIAVTAEDKSIRVFEHDGRGQLRHISQRVMPKRPCAIALTADESSIVCADKFGDVYSIPLMLPIASPGSDGQESSLREIDSVVKPSKSFVPAANDLTVHSVRNRRALQNQRRQEHSVSENSEPQFERKLLLGHVSMLTDIALAERNGQNYIITADRDEHIRISRGIPQAHIIEGYCLGHKGFVSRLCLPAERPNLLISGGGDDNIYVWDWPFGKLLHKVDLQSHAQEVMLEVNRGSNRSGNVEINDIIPPTPVKFAVSSIQHMRGVSDQQDDLIIVTCEGLPAIFILSLPEDSAPLHYQTLKLESNPLDIVTDSGLKIMIVSVDHAHEPGSTFKLRSDLEPIVHPLQMFQMIDSEWVKSPFQFSTESEANNTGDEGNKVSGRNFSDLLYPLEILRKIGGEE